MDRWLCAEHSTVLVDGVLGQGGWYERRDGQTVKFKAERGAAQKDERAALIREAIAAEFSPEEAGWRTVMFDNWVIPIDSDPETLRTPAALAWVDLQDRCRASDTLEGETFWQCMRQASWVRRAMLRVCRNQGEAKRWQLELTPAPLAFCHGTAKAWTEAAKRESLYPKKVCGRVFPDTLHDRGGGGSYWLHYCPEHYPQNVTASKRS